MTDTAATRSLQDVLDSEPSFVDYLYRNRKGSVIGDSVLRQPPPHVLPEFTSWRDEQRAWREGIAFYDQSFHMTTTYLRGPDAVTMLSGLAVNSFDTFGPGRSRHLVMCSPDGYLMHDGILVGIAENEIALVGRQAGHNYVRYHARNGGWDIEVEEDEIFSHHSDDKRTLWRYQVEGPDAPALIEELIGGPLPEAPKLHVLDVTIAGKPAKAMRHTMAGGAGAEFWGPWDDGQAVKEAIFAAGEQYQMRRVGSMAYFTNALELGWIPRPMPAIYTHDDLRPFREWLPATADEVTWGLGGSYNSPNIEDYYVTPWEIGYGNVVKFDKDYIGKDALQAAKDGDHRKKVTLVWDPADVAQVTESYLRADEVPPLYVQWPRATYATWQFDQVLDQADNPVGVSTYCGCIWNERAFLSLAVVDAAVAEPGSRVKLIWGEPDGGAKSIGMEPHRQVEINATVARAPIGEQFYR